MFSFLLKTIRNLIIYSKKSIQVISTSGFRHYIRLVWFKLTKKRKILVVDARMLTPDQDSGSYRMYGILSVLLQLKLEVTYVAVDLAYNEHSVNLLREKGINVITEKDVGSILDYIRDNGVNFDIVMLERVNVASWLMDHIKDSAPNATIFFDTVDLHFLREQRMGETIGSDQIKENAEKLKHEELRVASKADVTFVVSPHEKTVLRDINSDLCVEVLSNIHDVHKVGNSFAKRKDLMFIGGFEHVPNIDAMTYFVKDIFPLIQKKIGDIKLYIVGSKPPEEILDLASESIIVTGYVENISAYFRNTRVFIAPLRYGAGVKGKVNMSMSYGLPVVGTSMAAEGMFLNDGKDILIADNEEDFCRKVVTLYTEKSLWDRLSRNGLKNIRRYFSKQVAANVLRKVL